MSRVAIVGSCITRDLWSARGDAGPDLLYISRTSLPSLLAPAPRGFEPADSPPAGLGPFQHRALVEDIRKTALARLVAFRPTHLIFDFIDERFDLLSVAGTVVTHSWELEASGYLQQPALSGARTIPRRSAAAENLWRDAAAEFAALVRATPLRNARLVLHSGRWAQASRQGRGAPRPLTYEEPWRRTGASLCGVEQNRQLARYEAYFQSVMPPMAVVEAAAWRFADPDHRWGLSPFHYVARYYAAVWRRLERLGVELLSEAPAAPSAPAA